jgi:hypothetical protein
VGPHTLRVYVFVLGGGPCRAPPVGPPPPHKTALDAEKAVKKERTT